MTDVQKRQNFLKKITAQQRGSNFFKGTFFLAVSTGGHSGYVGILVSQICLQPRLEEITTLKNGDGADETDT